MELTKKELDAMRKRITQNNSIFADKKYLDSLFLPSNVIGRNYEASVLLRHIESLNQGHIVPVISVYGRSGSGKSTLVKFVCENVHDIAPSTFVNLRRAKTIFGCTNLILEEFGCPNLKSADGLNKAVEKIGAEIVKILRSENKKFFLLVLDEYDVIFSDSRNHPSDFVYKLLTLEEDLREKGFWLCIITISNNALSDHDLDDRVKSRMGSCEVFFPPYEYHNITDILRARADKAFRVKIGDEILQHCAKLSSDDHGDARRSLEMLMTAGELSDGKIITKSDIDEANRNLQRNRVSTIISKCPYHLKMLISSICVLSLYSETGWNATSVIYEKYKTLTKDSGSLSDRRVADLLVELENTGLTTSRTLSRGRYGYGKEHKLKLSPDIVGSAIDAKWWYRQLNEKIMHDSHQRLQNLLKGKDRIKVRANRILEREGLSKIM